MVALRSMPGVKTSEPRFKAIILGAAAFMATRGAQAHTASKDGENHVSWPPGKETRWFPGGDLVSRLRASSLYLGGICKIGRFVVKDEPVHALS